MAFLLQLTFCTFNGPSYHAPPYLSLLLYSVLPEMCRVVFMDCFSTLTHMQINRGCITIGSKRKEIN